MKYQAFEIYVHPNIIFYGVVLRIEDILSWSVLESTHDAEIPPDIKKDRMLIVRKEHFCNS